jgi:hypothetical protein
VDLYLILLQIVFVFFLICEQFCFFMLFFEFSEQFLLFSTFFVILYFLLDMAYLTKREVFWRTSFTGRFLIIWCEVLLKTSPFNLKIFFWGKLAGFCVEGSD